MENTFKASVTSVFRLMAVAGLLIAAGCGGGSGSSGGGPGGVGIPPIPPSNVSRIVLTDGGIVGQDDTFSPVDGDTASGGHGQLVDGQPCGLHNIHYHIHAHLSLFVSGTRLAIPDTIGINNPSPEVKGYTASGSCFYDIHTHDAQGLMHIEASTVTQFQLSQFFGIWGQPLSANNVAGHFGTVQAYIATAPSGALRATNFIPYNGSLGAIPLQQHEEIVLEVGPPFVTPPSLPDIIFQY